MTYFKAIRLLRSRGLSAGQQINRNMTIATGNMCFVVMCFAATLIFRVFAATHASHVIVIVTERKVIPTHIYMPPPITIEEAEMLLSDKR